MEKSNDSRMGRHLNEQWEVRAQHALYRENGTWYHHLTRFPGALFDANGYLVFDTQEEYQRCKYLQLGKQLSVPGGISSVPGYVNVTIDTSFDKLAEEIFDTKKITEGAVKRITINAYERNSIARKKCIAHYGHKCAVCSFDFAEVYGAIGKDFIHVHHLKQLSEIKREYVVDPVKDLVPVCPNCHAMLHRREPPLAINELRSIFKKYSGNCK
jgi:predicted HNH restriction endonuclease